MYSDRSILLVHTHSIIRLDIHCLLTVQNSQELGRNMLQEYYVYIYIYIYIYIYMCVCVCVCVCAYVCVCIQGVSRLVDITAGGDFLGLYDQKSS